MACQIQFWRALMELPIQTQLDITPVLPAQFGCFLKSCKQTNSFLTQSWEKHRIQNTRPLKEKDGMPAGAPGQCTSFDILSSAGRVPVWNKKTRLYRTISIRLIFAWVVEL
jgi:hypothetical protein